MSVDALPPDGVLIEVRWTSVNYKDALASTPAGRVARLSPLVVGIDLAGRVVDSGSDGPPVGTEVLAHGYDLGVSRHGDSPSTPASPRSGSSRFPPVSACATPW